MVKYKIAECILGKSMKKTKKLILVLIVVCLTLITATGYSLSKSQLDLQFSKHNEVVQEPSHEGPTGYYIYQDIEGTLNPNQGDPYGPGSPYSVSVKINSVTTGYKVTVNILVNDVSQWTGDLGPGQSSPTITCSGGTTYVRVINLNGVTVDYAGRVNWYFN